MCYRAATNRSVLSQSKEKKQKLTVLVWVRTWPIMFDLASGLDGVPGKGCP